MKMNSVILGLTAASLILGTPSNSLADSANYFTESTQKQLCSNLKQNSERCYKIRSSAADITLNFKSNNEATIIGSGAALTTRYGNYSRNGNVYTVNWYKSCTSGFGCNTQNNTNQYIVTESGNLRAEGGGLFIPCN